MNARFARLRIAGFKSFAEPAGLDILPGLTGIVGPNGCGKSNVVEALRWAMGETSARSLRGGEMDDVIFAGTTARASRNLAEVTITLEAAAAPLPAPFEAEAELQVTRRIERGAGSAFRANGRELRARDVQTLFADLASGARSSGMVSQGRVAALVHARPEERRQLLEEAAGITGLHARRHEAELKLRAAEQNLSRSEDLRTELDGTREGLRRQARQAARYRGLSGLVRDAEADHLAILHGRAAATAATASAAAAQAERAARDAAAEQQDAEAALDIAEAALPEPRRQEADARIAMERRRLEAETLAAEAGRVRQEADEAAERLAELEADLAGAGHACDDAGASIARLSAERDRVAARLAALPDEAAAAVALADAARTALRQAQSAADDAAAQAAAAVEAARRAEDARRSATGRLATLRDRQGATRRELAECEAARIDRSILAEAGQAVADRQAALLAARDAFHRAEAARAAAADAAIGARARAAREQAAHEAADLAARTASERALQAREACEAARATLTRLHAERVDADTLQRAEGLAERAEAALAESEARIERAERAASASAAAAAEARRASQDAASAWTRAGAALAAAQARAGRVAGEAEAASQSMAEATRSAPDPSTVQAAKEAWASAAALLPGCEQALQDGQARHRRCALEAAQARRTEAEAAAEAARLAAVASGLQAAIGADDGAAGTLAALQVPDGLEAAVGAALGERAGASLDPDAPSFWRNLPAMSAAPLPPGSVALSALVGAPPQLARALSHAALLADDADGEAVQARLPAGMVAVDRAGGCWRWDGHVTRAGAPNQAAALLAQQRRLARARADADGASAAAADVRTRRVAAEQAETEAARQDGQAQAACALAREALTDAARRAEQLVAEAAHAADRIAALQPAIERLRTAGLAAESEVETARRVLDGLPDPTVLEGALNEAEAEAEAMAVVLEAARDTRRAALAHAAETRVAAQVMAGTAAQAKALAAAAADAHARAVQDLDAAGQAASAALAARDALADPARLRDAAERAAFGEAACRDAELEARRAGQEREADLDRARREEATLLAAHMQAETRLTALVDLAERGEADLGEAEREAAEAAKGASLLPDPGPLAETVRRARAACDAARQHLGAAEMRQSALAVEQAHALRAAADCAAELDAWQHRLREATARLAGLRARSDAARSAWSALACRPDEVTARAGRSGQALSDATAAHAAAAARLDSAERRHRALANAERDAALRASEGRERQTRAQAASEAAAHALQAVLDRAAERLGPECVAMNVRDAPPDLSEMAEERARRRFERLSREREEMGPVNLLAERELEELTARLDALEAERAELGTAIAKLRGAIGQLNREGRERLAAVFAAVDQHFRILFTRMMGGGRAHLALTGSEDPLAAGLEIYAEPPGKKLSALSLLSGGEQALTALSLIFAVFRCTPAPLCVLDEVDAPLDDANVERFCTLLDEMVRDTGTSFLVVTHHQLTMSRMDRLFGVTMQERGVSRLLSVDLTRAAALVEPVMQAAE